MLSNIHKQSKRAFQNEVDLFSCITLREQRIKPIDLARLQQRDNSSNEVFVLAVKEMDLLCDVLLSQMDDFTSECWRQILEELFLFFERVIVLVVILKIPGDALQKVIV